mmetsp:Transcript_119414/g.234650  ORF Transcript_119414/g.234650 Transcript_119414/m.234650 type:complete len:182 (-) Transcript_119414:118-663(-)|eukprot:CAMPEP_0170358878 /NCGR_PEP_ID=MMETSP0117_2-20130122/2454_1 /TAXON_ID=400756 /ORGANISM="Durinskia baltica, Strain CSIRO CS-38" /LENGTH=181 /DNA_ID=CAMNT_0010613099 /DNA_START=122 /DNA_END=667 /DNA_ORIENTATION=+
MKFNIVSTIISLLIASGIFKGVEAGQGSNALKHFISGFAPLDSIVASSEPSDVMKFFNDFSILDYAPSMNSPSLAFDARESNTTYEIICDLPGVPKKDISLSLKDNELTIKAVRDTITHDEGTTYRRVERQSGEISRNIILPDDVVKDKIKAESKDGVLIVTIPKVPQPVEEANIIQIQVL